MAISLRVTGTWAELTADGAVAIPATPQAGDRMYLLARWKDFSVTAQVTSPVAWDEITEFADGAVSAGNGTGSVKVACWYRDWQSGDTDPIIDFSAAPENASVVIMVMQKGADDFWTTPVAVTAAMTNWTTSSQMVSASASVAVPSGGVVIGLIGIRDDSATMTRPSTGIDDSAAAVTWNGNYVESPATHHSTTTGFDGAADLGYRLVTIGATATLRMTGTISAAETGAALWVIQGTTIVVTPATASLEVTTQAPTLALAVAPAIASLSLSTFAPALKSVIIPSSAVFIITGFSPSLALGIVPAPAVFEITPLAPILALNVTPETANLSISTFSPSLINAVVPATLSLTISSFAPSLTAALMPATLNLSLITFAPSIWPFIIVYLDPGGDSVQAIGHFNTVVSDGSGISYDTSQKVVGAGSYKFDSETGITTPTVTVNSILGTEGHRRVSFFFRYDSVPDAIETAVEFVNGSGASAYSGGGFSDISDFNADDGFYATATPAKNAGQGSVFASFGFGIPIGAVIDSIKFIYELKFDTDASEGSSRVKWRVNSEEGPDHDNTDRPLTDTVVEVDVTADRAWEWQDLQDGVFEVIAEARRGDTDTAHTQSWDYIKVEVEYHLPTVIAAAMDVDNLHGLRIAITPKDDAVVTRFIDALGGSYDGITKLFPDTWNRIGFSYFEHSLDDTDIKVYVNGIEELSIETAPSGDTSPPLLHLRYGWLLPPGADHLCWFDQIYVDKGNDLTDPGNVLITAKLPAAVNEDNWSTTGTGAVDERPLSVTSYRQQAAGTQLRQTYTLQTAATGDVDISGETLLGYLGWAWTKRSGDLNQIALIVNNTSFTRGSLSSTPVLLRNIVATNDYPSHAAGIGMLSDDDSATVFMYECGVAVAYEGPPNPDILLERQQVNSETLDTIIDDLRADPPDSYEVCCHYDEFDGTVQIVIYSLDQDGGSFQEQGTLQSLGRLRITPGVEVRLDVTVVGVTNLQIYRRINFD